MEIIPNWHPIFVHFTVALFSVAVLFLILSYLLATFTQKPNFLASEFEIVGRWNLWLTALITIGTALAGLHAYNTVKHDEVSHAVMTTHRNLAITTAAIILLLATWSLRSYYKHKNFQLTFIIVLLIGQGLLLTTAWYGGELVYRHGTGVMSLPKEKNSNHRHEHEMTNENKDQKHSNEHQHLESNEIHR